MSDATDRAEGAVIGADLQTAITVTAAVAASLAESGIPPTLQAADVWEVLLGQRITDTPLDAGHWEHATAVDLVRLLTFLQGRANLFRLYGESYLQASNAITTAANSLATRAILRTLAERTRALEQTQRDRDAVDWIVRDSARPTDPQAN